MNRGDIPQAKAAAHFRSGHNCAQSVLLALSEAWSVKSDAIPKVATGFGGGIGRCGSVCGALTGAVMALGLRYGIDEPSLEKRQLVYSHARTLYRQFEKQFGTVLCRDLIGYDLSDPEQLRKARADNILEHKCQNYVRKAVEIALQL